ncbi:MAG: hypothetical protein P0119_07685 [Nitrospira sp.]|nr:hypothetical protein [Nitrospira sp.]
MTSSFGPESGADPEKAPFERLRSKGFLKKHRYLLVGSAIVLVTVSSIVSIRGKPPQPADRPTVTVQEATIVGPLVQHNIPTAKVLLKNTGHSPALATQARLVMTVWTSNTFPDWEMPLKLTTDAEPIGKIVPGSVVPQTVSLIAPLTDVQGMHLERKDWFIVILGVVSYDDLFRNPHETKLCLIWRDTTTQHLSRCEQWNEAN